MKFYAKVFLMVILIFPFVANTFAQAPDTLWTKTYGGIDNDSGLSVQQTSDGGYIIAGYTRSFGAGETDVYLIRTDSNGDTLWTRAFGGNQEDIAYSVQQTSDLVILTEGPRDKIPLQILLQKMNLLSKYNIKFWALGGDIMNQQDLSVLAESYNLFALIDRDPGSEKSRKEFIQNCKEVGIPYHRLERYSLENYFPLRAYKEVFGSQIPAEVEEIKPNVKVSDQISLDPKNRLKQVAMSTELSDLKDTDLEKVLRQINQMLQKDNPQKLKMGNV